VAFASKVKAGSMAMRATMYPTRHAAMSDDQTSVPAAGTAAARAGVELSPAVEARGLYGAEGHPA